MIEKLIIPKPLSTCKIMFFYKLPKVILDILNSDKLNFYTN